MNPDHFVFLLALILFIAFGLKKLAETSKFQLFGQMITRVDTPEKVIALTYDDGPHPIYTRRLLKVLNQFQVKATFFVIGHQVEQYPEIAQDVHQQGHELGNHSYSHRRLILTSRSAIRDEIAKTDRLIRELGVQQAIHFRAPFGYKRVRLPLVLSQLKKKNVLWNLDPRDYRASSSESVVDYVLDQASPGAIVLLHDGGGDRALTAEATAQLIPRLQAQGYRFATVSELLSLQTPAA
jgi:peptidoglycan-N-acetylglucosamine deacetylase